ncbi:hypothetical protein CANCADRAFT_21590 [Tortispora caseinolytica NRRL Y-17796]|uniref:Cdc23 domain-containing protein n=1 Tax=Tortispora caseinolytica NRRL Y-17796 TaxID=767744 RepID=A0A1E4TM06_9ASCO|nr:hypothetical protein CANCADRAFT_21590 [Tortispora caseinolytica NRRL Y-17796]
MNDEIHVLANDLAIVIPILLDRGLFQSAKWASELLDACPVDETNLDLPSYVPESATRLPSNPRKFLFAKSCFECKEYARAANILEKFSHDPVLWFMGLYAKYLAGECKRDQDGELILGRNSSSSTPNTYCNDLIQQLEARPEDVQNDPFLLYLHGTIALQLNQHQTAIDSLIASINLFPYIWSAFVDLSRTITSVSHLATVLDQINESPMKSIFRISIEQELAQHSPALVSSIESWQMALPNSLFIQVQRALVHYHSLEYQKAEALFDNIIKRDPFRIEDLDVFSNILYISGKAPKLSFLAQLTSSVDKLRPETCCIIANFYSIRNNHIKAITYYRRALMLNRSYLSAWTLMGHEFVELKNSHAAIESYRRATDINRRDFRAWYGLGQAYEVLDMHYYSLSYYQRAVALKPQDPRMWHAVASCYERLDRKEDAIKAFSRALELTGPDPVMHYRLGLLYDSTDDRDNAITHMRAVLEFETENDFVDEVSKARLWLAKRALADRDWAEAEELAAGLLQGQQNDVEEARSIVRDVRQQRGK